MTEEDKENSAAATGEASKMDATPADAATGAAVAGTPANTADAPAAEHTANASDASESASEAGSSSVELVPGATPVKVVDGVATGGAVSGRSAATSSNAVNASGCRLSTLIASSLLVCVGASADRAFDAATAARASGEG